ncbi:MAG: hypothetical protein NVSMB63_14300 [Sediminibacterium sp.]
MRHQKILFQELVCLLAIVPCKLFGINIWTKDGFVVENQGVSPDIEVEQSPAEVIKGNDPQRPPYPVKVKK